MIEKYKYGTYYGRTTYTSSGNSTHDHECNG